MIYTVGELRKILEQYDDDAEIIIFDEYASYVAPIESVCDNEGSLQINMEG